MFQCHELQCGGTPILRFPRFRLSFDLGSLIMALFTEYKDTY